MKTSKRAVQQLADLCEAYGIKHVVFSPGSRSAPLVIAFGSKQSVQTAVIPDERVAGYFALGIAQQTGKPVAVVCTSGTAVLNLAPAVCEAFYQNIPLLLLTADRPEGAHTKGENQAIVQNDIFGAFSVWSTCIDGDSDKPENEKHISEIVAKAFLQLQKNGPVHINIHMEEPLYSSSEYSLDVNAEKSEPERRIADSEDWENISSAWKAVRKKVILLGMGKPTRENAAFISAIAEQSDVVVWKEATSNFSGNGNVLENADQCIAALRADMEVQMAPDLVLTLGNQIVSKRIKSYLQKFKPVHFDIAPENTSAGNRDLFGSLKNLKQPDCEKVILEKLTSIQASDENRFAESWIQLAHKTRETLKAYCCQIPFSDLKVFDTLIKHFPEQAHIQYGNSSPIRYANLFNHPKDVIVNANRGTSGIDGCVSTAAGAAYATGKLTINIVGDVSFIYDSNALWNNHLSPLLRIIVINNGGGNIFRLIEGPTRIAGFEKYFETAHTLNASHLASMYGLRYYICNDQKSLENTLSTFYQNENNRAAILEVKTSGDTSAHLFKKYFEQLKP